MRQDSPSNQPFGAQVVQVNTLSNPVLVLLIVALSLIAVVSGGSIGVALYASYMAQIAEREARLAQNRNDTIEVDVKVMRGLLEKQGIKMSDDAKR
jgi:hypothetical protein